VAAPVQFLIQFVQYHVGQHGRHHPSNNLAWLNMDRTFARSRAVGA
jgi:hypothetical protein